MSNSEAFRIEDEPGRQTVLTLLPPLNDVDWASLEQLGNELLGVGYLHRNGHQSNRLPHS